MKRKAWISFVCSSLLVPASFALVATAQAETTKVGDFALIDHLGDQYQMARLGMHKAVVLISQANSCSDNIDKLHKYKLLRTTWEPLGVKFLMINSSTRDDLEGIRSAAKVYDIDFPILNDTHQLAAETLGIEKAGEILVLDPKSLQLLYRGPLDKPQRRRRDDDEAEQKPVPQPLNDTLAMITEGKHESAGMVTVAVDNDCAYNFPARQMHTQNLPDYADDIAPLLKENCAHCHVEGGIGPFAMDSYEMVRGWAPMIREVVMTKRMPPAQVDPSINHFTNANYFNAKQTQTLVHWIDAGAPRGDSKDDPLHSVKPLKSDWQLGKPDVVLDVPEFTVPATGVLDYLNPTIELNFDEDKYVKAVQFIPGDTRAMHHLLAYVVAPDNTEAMDEENVRDFLEGYAPGKTDATTFPDDTAVFIPKGYNLRLSVHYTPFGKEVVDRTKIGLYFSEEQPDYKFLTKSISHGGSNLVIRPDAADHAMNMSYVFENNIRLFALRPHMHFRGKAFRFTAILPDGTRKPLLNVPGYNFNWQPTYRFAEPIDLPAGTRVVNDAVFDNSAYNTGNPDPSAVVKGGPQSWDEMFIGYYTYINLDDNQNEQQLTSAE